MLHGFGAGRILTVGYGGGAGRILMRTLGIELGGL